MEIIFPLNNVEVLNNKIKVLKDIVVDLNMKNIFVYDYKFISKKYHYIFNTESFRICYSHNRYYILFYSYLGTK